MTIDPNYLHILDGYTTTNGDFISLSPVVSLYAVNVPEEYYNPPNVTTTIFSPLTEEDIRRIIREELQRFVKDQQKKSKKKETKPDLFEDLE